MTHDSNLPKEYRYRYKLPLVPIDDATTTNSDGSPDTLIHATTVSRVTSALKEGIAPNKDLRCLILGKSLPPYTHDDEIELELTMRRCKERGVHFWNDPNEAVYQSLSMVGILKEDNPAILITNMEDLNTDYDPTWQVEGPDSPRSYIHPNAIDPERIECICTLHEDLLPTVGAIMCPVVHGKDSDCPSLDASDITTFNTLTNPENWSCHCKKGRISDEIQDRVLNELSEANR